MDECAGNNITLNINGELEKNQETVAEHFADYFSTMANNIGGTDILNLKEENFSAHICIQKHKGNAEWVWQTTFHFLQRTASRVN